MVYKVKEMQKLSLHSRFATLISAGIAKLIIAWSLKNGSWIKLRSIYPDHKSFLKILKGGQNIVFKNVSKYEKILLVGLGPAALTFAKNLRAEGFDDVSIFSDKLNYGGKCVNYGCMPSSYLAKLNDIRVEKRQDYILNFVNKLREGVANIFGNLGYVIHQKRLVSINGNYAAFDDGSNIEFDRLVIATGASYTPPNKVPLKTNRKINLSELWELPSGKKVVIYGDCNPAALSLGHIASNLGLQAIVLLRGKSPIEDLPSFRFYSSKIGSSGVSTKSGIRLIRVDEDELFYEEGAEIKAMSFDYLLVAGQMEPNYPIIDGQKPSILDLNLKNGSLIGRGDITCIGDAFGCMTYSEAELQAHMAFDLWRTGVEIDVGILARLPFSFHGETPLAIVGSPTTLVANIELWEEVDFNILGNTKIQGSTGKLWYLYDTHDEKVKAFHICHADASNLIAIASLLLEKRLDDPIWGLFCIHPSSSEIFKEIHAQIILKKLKNKWRN
jgi:pyruvate/2-oxoglutarate dehydrogenase complex dihydrolipoamide dehydrogenase (E3) component